MKRYIRRWLGIEGIHTDIGLLHRTSIDLFNKLENKLDVFQSTLAEPISNLSTVLTDEHSSARKAASDKIGAEALKRASAEDKARRHTLRELE